MRIVFLATDAYGGRGGIAYYNRCLAEALAEQPDVREIVVLVRQISDPTGDIPDKIRLVSSAAGSKLRYMVAFMAQSFSPYDLVICGHINLIPIAVLFSKLKRMPLVLQVHGIDAWKPLKNVRRLLKKVDAVWAVSSVTRDRMNEWAGIPISKYSLTPNTIHPERYGLAPKRLDLLDRYELRGHKVIVSMGRLASSERYKGFDEIMDVMPSLIQREPRLSYLILGDGDDRARLEQKAKILGMSDRIRFAGYVAEKEKADHLRLGDVFAMPGRGEGFGVVFLEAMACGIPVVGSKLDGSRDALREGLLGELANPDDPQSIEDSIIQALSKPRQVPEGLSYFTWESFSQRIQEAMRKVASGS